MVDIAEVKDITDITNINKEVLLESLWENSKPIPFYRRYRVSPPLFDLEKAKKQVKSDGFADYILGRLIKVNLQEDNTDATQYNLNNGIGKLQKIVKKIRESN